MLWLNGLGGFLVLGCLYQGLNTHGQQVVRRLIVPALLIMVMVVIALTLWCTLFYSFIGLPLSLVRPWGVWEFVLQTQQMNLLTNVELWGFPIAGVGLCAANLITPLLAPSWRHLYGNANWANKNEVKKM